MPQTSELDIVWRERYAWWPVRSTWSKKRIFLAKYWHGQIHYNIMGGPPFTKSNWVIILTENQYLLKLLCEDKAKWQHPRTK